MADQPEKTGNPIIDEQQERVARASGHDKKRMRMALGIALAVHLVILAIKLPELTEAEPPEEPDEKPYVVHQVKFRPPPPPPPDQPPPPEPEPPTPEARTIPVPDPEPDEPEPIVEPEPEPEPVPEPLPRPEEVVEIVEQPRPAPPQDLPAPDVAVTIPEGPPPAPQPTGPIRVGGDVKAPVKTHSPDPRYTSSAQAARVEGVVIIEAVINKQGRVTSTKILKDLPMGLGSAAENAVKTWRFRPATLNGRPVDVYYNLTVNFELD